MKSVSVIFKYKDFWIKLEKFTSTEDMRRVTVVLTNAERAPYISSYLPSGMRTFQIISWIKDSMNKLRSV